MSFFICTKQINYFKMIKIPQNEEFKKKNSTQFELFPNLSHRTSNYTLFFHKISY